MKLRFITVLIILIISVSCTKKTALETSFDCSNPFLTSNSKEIKDVKKKLQNNDSERLEN